MMSKWKLGCSYFSCLRFVQNFLYLWKKKKKAHQSLSITDVQENISCFLASDDYSNKREQRVKLSHLSCHKTVLWEALCFANMHLACTSQELNDTGFVMPHNLFSPTDLSRTMFSDTSFYISVTSFSSVVGLKNCW